MLMVVLAETISLTGHDEVDEVLTKSDQGGMEIGRRQQIG